jgi:osmotically-inducible protein OsmY
MKRFLWLVPVVLSASVILPGCKDASNPRSTEVPNSERRADTGKMSNSDVEKAIRAKLESDADTRQANLSVSADASDNKATIKGTVASQDVRTKAIELARSAQPGLTINDEIEVRPAG